ncbi:VWFA domain-containing protein [Plasmodiophora brassicae]
MKEAVVFAIDVGSTMTAEGIAQCKSVLRHELRRKFIQGGQDEVGLVTFGSGTTRNVLNDEHSGEYVHVEVVSGIVKPDVSMMEHVDVIDLSGEEVEGDTFDAIVVALNELHVRVKKLKFEKRVVVLTSAGGESPPPDQIEEIASLLKGQNCTVKVVFLGDKNGHTENRAALKLLVKYCEGESMTMSIDEALAIASRPAKKSVRPTAKYKGPFEITSIVKLNVSTYGKTMIANLPSLKKQSDRAPDSDIKLQTASFNKQTNTEVEREHRVKAYRYGKDRVAISNVDEAMYECTTSKCLQVMGFLPRTSLPRHLFMSSVDCVVANPDYEATVAGFQAVMIAMTELDYVAIVRYVKRDGVAAKLAVLHPGIENRTDVAYLNILPFADDMRQYDFGSVSGVQVTKRQLDAADALIDNLDLSRAWKSPEGEDVEALDPDFTYNPVLQRFYEALEIRSLDPDAPIPDLSHDVRSAMEPMEDLFDAAQSSFDAFKQVFPLEAVPEKKKRAGGERADWRAQLEAATAEGVDGVPSTISSIEDYQHLMANPETSATATLRLVDVVVKTLDESFQGSADTQALDWLETARTMCRTMAMFDAYNNALEVVKERVPPAFLDKMASRGLYPIDSSECKGSPVAPEEARLFFTQPFPTAIADTTGTGNDDESSIWDEWGDL